jgi:lysophospholipase L1-like esterase
MKTAILSILCAAALVSARGQDTPAPVAPRPPPAPLNPGLPTLFIVGDSTAADNGSPMAVGWGIPFATYWDASKINVANRARGGRSSRTFVTEGLWDKVLSEMKPGDIVLLQFGHNDAGAINDSSRARGSIHGIGDDTREIDNELTGKHEVVHTFGWYMRKMIAETKAKGATPVVLGLTVRDIWHGDVVERGPADYSALSAEIARSAGVPFLDLTSLVADAYERLGQDKVKAFFPRDHTHTSAAGGELNASLVVAGLRRLNLPGLNADLSDKGRAVPEPPPHVRRKPPVPANPALPTLFLIGDSTVRNGEANGAGGQWGWGEPIAAYFDRDKINVVNRAVGGLSSRTYLTGGYWARTLPLIKPGDVVIMQFGRNDAGAVNDRFRARASLPGVGGETEEIDNLLTKKHEVVHTFGWYLEKFIADTRAKGAIPIVCSLTPQKNWRDGTVVYENLARWAGQAARAGGADFVDLEALIIGRYVELGPDGTEAMYGDPHTHNSWEGAVLNAECVVSGLKSLPDDPLAPYFSAAGRAILPPASGFLPPNPAPGFWAYAPKPAMGWNSWDDFATTITESQAKAEADALAERLGPHGWRLLTVDIQWYEPAARGFDYRRNAQLTMDGWGRLQPAPNRFPSAAAGAGFRDLAAYVHSKGLEFGIHLLRGIPRQAVDRNLPILGSDAHAADIADKTSVCPWNTDMVGVDTSKPGAQAYYDSVFAQFAQWGVDFVKVDDLSQPYHAGEIAAIRTAIDRSGRPMALSLSPGPTPLDEGRDVAVHANQWRISGDFWDDWGSLLAQFARLDRWTPFRGPGHFPDADMLPLGTIDLGRRTTRFTPDEQRTLMTLWSIARSPLILGADLAKLDASTLALLTDDEVIAVDQDSSGNRQLFRRDGLVGWVADVPGSPDRYLALFNTRDKPASGGAGTAVAVPLSDLGWTGPVRVRDLWARADLGQVGGTFSPVIPWHGAGLYRLGPSP